MSALSIDIISDVVCPWCFIGKRHLDKALDAWRLERPEISVSVTWHPYFLNPDTPESGEAYRPFLEKKFGGPEQLLALWNHVSEAGRNAGIAFAFEKIELRANTLNAHRLIHHAQKVDAEGTAVKALIENLFTAQFIQGRHIGDRSILADIAIESGMNAVEVRRYLNTNEDADVVRDNADEAKRMGINGVPFFIFNQRISASGAQPPEELLSAMHKAVAAGSTT